MTLLMSNLSKGNILPQCLSRKTCNFFFFLLFYLCIRILDSYFKYCRYTFRYQRNHCFHDNNNFLNCFLLYHSITEVALDQHNIWLIQLIEFNIYFWRRKKIRFSCQNFLCSKNNKAIVSKRKTKKSIFAK